MANRFRNKTKAPATATLSSSRLDKSTVVGIVFALLIILLAVLRMENADRELKKSFVSTKSETVPSGQTVQTAIPQPKGVTRHHFGGENPLEFAYFWSAEDMTNIWFGLQVLYGEKAGKEDAQLFIEAQKRMDNFDDKMNNAQSSFEFAASGRPASIVIGERVVSMLYTNSQFKLDIRARE